MMSNISTNPTVAASPLTPTTPTLTTSQSGQQNPIGDASAITLLLSNHEIFGFSERACYHFDLIETLTQTPEAKIDEQHLNQIDGSIDTYTGNTDKHSNTDTNILSPISEHQDKQDHNINDTDLQQEQGFPLRRAAFSSGVISLLECIGQTQIRQPKLRRKFTKKIKDFNKHAENERSKHQLKNEDYCHQPTEFPSQVNIQTRISFVYELTRMVFCIDASPTLTATFGNLGNAQQAYDGAICAMDRLDSMTRLFFRGLVQPIRGISKFYERKKSSSTMTTAATMATYDHDGGWFPHIAVTVVACYPKSMLPSDDEEAFAILVGDFRIHDTHGADILCDKIAAWVAMEVESSIAAKFSRTGGRLESSSSSLQQIIETCEACDTATLPSEARPCFVIATDCRAIDCDGVMDIVQNDKLKDTPLHILDLSGKKTHRMRNDSAQHENQTFDLMYDHDGPSSFPLSITDDSEALYIVCKSTLGHFFDGQLLKDACNAIAGEEATDSSFYEDPYFSFKRRTLKPNGLQWYVIFSLSQCCSLPTRSSGNTPLVNYIKQRRELHKMGDKPTMFLKYKLSPVRVKSILILRMMDGFRTRKYGSDTQDADKVSIQFTLNIELGTVIQYTLSFVSSRFHNAMVGSINVRISLLGESSFIQMVKKRYFLNQLNNPVNKSNLSAKDIVCDKICEFLKGIRDGDSLESKICPLDWKDKLSDDSHFLTSLRNMNNNQFYRHFRLETFEVLCILPSEADADYKSTEEKLLDLISTWSNKTLAHNRLYLRKLPTTEGELTNYCLIEVIKSDLNLRVYTLNMHFFEQVDSQVRVSFLESLRMRIASFGKYFLIPPRPLSKFVSSRHNGSVSTTVYNAVNLYQCQSWELLNDSELIPLITKKRCQFDNFYPIYVTNGCTILVKFVVDESGHLSLVQYSLRRLEEKVIVNLFMDYQRGDFSKAFHRFNVPSPKTMFSDICDALEERDQLCSRALRSRKNLLNLFDLKLKNPEPISIDQTDDVNRLLQHADKFSIMLRFFNEESGKANEILEELTINFMLSSSLHFEVTELTVGNSDYKGIPGKWFMIRLNIDTLSILHFPCCEQNDNNDFVEESFAFRELTIFLITITNLCFDQTEEKDNIHDDGMEYGDKISILSEEIKIAHGRNYSLASYLALREKSSDVQITFSPLDFEHALSFCKEHQITDDIEIKSNTDTDKDCQSNFESKLAAFIGEVLNPVPDGAPYFYFDGEMNENYEIIYQSNVDISDNTKKKLTQERNQNFSEPLFVFFTLDGKPASLEDLQIFSLLTNQSGILNAFITTFKDSEMSFSRSKESQIQLLKVHDAVAHNLVTRLNSFVAEQTLERLRWEYEFLKNVEYESVKRCLLEADNVVESKIPVHFYFSKTDSMLDASTSIAMEGDFQQRFSLLCECISQQKLLIMKEISNGEFFASDVEEKGWCFVGVPEDHGFIFVYVYHPLGNEEAEKTAMLALRAVSDACHRANQMLLLEHMHKTRTASSLMIPEHNKVITQPEITCTNPIQQNNILDYPAGYFRCDVSFKTSYSLNKRCKSSNVIIHLESYVLHRFALLNRRGIFVYKDEDDCIFYMELQQQQGDEDKLDQVCLVVYGIQRAGPSITNQLNHLLQKELMLICTENISCVLAKNRHYHLWPSDIQFIYNFNQNWKKLEGEESVLEGKEIFAFPTAVYDPVLVLLYFKQNISGSSFFTHWRDTEQKDEEILLEDSLKNESNGIPFNFSKNEFNLCYNASQFQAAEFQPISTLTEAGKQFARMAGTGVALIEIKLLDSKLEPFESLCIGMVPDDDMLPIQIDRLKFCKLQSNEKLLSKYHVSVRVVSTTIKSHALYRWIELTLNQALSSWIMERHLERLKFTSNSLISEKIIGFGKIVQNLHNLPHPAMRKVELNGNVKSSDMSKLLFNILDCLIHTIFDGKKYHLNEIHCLQTARFCEVSSRLVRLFHLPGHQTVHTIDFNTNELIIDNPAMNVQYVSSFGLNNESEKIWCDRKKSRQRVPPTSLLFERVCSFDDNTRSGSLSNALLALDKSNSHLLIRRAAFVVVMTRTSTTILFYNLNPNIYETIIPRLKDLFNEVNTLKESYSNIKGTVAPEVSSSKSASNSTSILMPTIIGKSVKGSAMHAVVRARARATTGRTGNSSKSTKLGTGNNPTPRVMQRSKLKALNEKKNKSEKKETNEILRYLPSPLAKEYISTLSLMNRHEVQTFTTANILQKLFLSWLSKLKGKEIPTHALESILMYANFVNVQTFPLLQSIFDDPCPFLRYFSRVVVSQNMYTTVLAKNFSWSKDERSRQNVKNPVVYIMRNIFFSEQKCMLFIYEISVISHAKHGKIGRVRCWSLISCHGNSLVRKEGSLTNLNLNCELFNFALSTLRGTIKHHLLQNHHLNIPSLLRETTSLFPYRIQRRTRIGKWFRLFHGTVPWEESLSFSLTQFFEYVHENNEEYGLVDCSGLFKCIGGQLCGNVKNAHFFITPTNHKHQDKEMSTFDLFVISFTNGRDLDNLVEKDSYYGKRKSLSQHISHRATSAVLDILNRVSIDFQRDQMWVEQSGWI